MTKAEESWCHALVLDANLKCLRSVIFLFQVTNGTYRRSILDQGGAIIAVPFNPHTLDVTQIL